jgi:Tfp pilus assembly protein PilF
MASPISLATDTLAARILLPLVALLFLAGCIFVLRWCIADAATARVNDPAIAELLTTWAPDDPQTHYSLAALYEKSYQPEDGIKAVVEYEKAAALSPGDYRYWIPLARAREHNGDIAGAETALRYALNLAPSYAQIHWSLGNVLLREGKTDEAFAEMRQAIDANPVFAVTAASTALQFSDEGYAAILQKLGNSAETKAAMAMVLARQKKFDDSLAVWKTLSDEERNTAFKDQGAELFNTLLAEKKFRLASQIRTLQAAGTFSNPGFEAPIDLTDTSPFNWRIAQGAQPLIGVDANQKHGGNYSLGIVFAKNSGKDFRQVSQNVPVQSSAAYHFTIFIRSEINATGALRWELADAETGAVLGSTKDISGAANGWEELTADVRTGPQAEALIVRLVKAGCQNCSIEGKVWFDDLALEKR